MCEKEISFGQICVLILYDIPDYHLNSQYLGPETQGTLTFYRVVFLTGPPDFQYQNEKQVAANQD